MNTTLEVTVKDVYGKQTVYPANEVAEKFAAIAGTKTMTHQLLSQVEALGFTIVNVTSLAILGR